MTRVRGVSSEGGVTMEPWKPPGASFNKGSFIVVCERDGGMVIESSPSSVSESVLNAFCLISGKLCTL
jgi:hypothetical protein